MNELLTEASDQEKPADWWNDHELMLHLRLQYDDDDDEDIHTLLH